MLKRLMFLGLCLSSLYVQCSPELKQAIEELDVEAVVKILDENPKALTANELNLYNSQLKGEIGDAAFDALKKTSVGMLAGFLSGFYVFEGRSWARDFVRSRFWDRGDRAARLLDDDGRMVAFAGTMTAMVIGAYASSFFWRNFDAKKAQTISDLLMKVRR